MNKLLLLILACTSFGFCSAQKSVATKLVKDLNHEEHCAYVVLKKLVLAQSENPEKAVFFAKATIKRENKKISIETTVQTKLKNDPIVRKNPFLQCILELERVSYHAINKADSVSNDSVIIKSYTEYEPRFKLGKMAICSAYEWYIVNEVFNYYNGEQANTEFFVENENSYDHVQYVDTNYAIVSLNNKFGIISKFNKVLLPMKYNYLIKNDIGLLARDSGSYFFIDPITKTKLSNDYNNVNIYAMWDWPQKLFPVMRDGKQTCLTKDFKEFLPLIYDHLEVKGNDFQSLIGYRNNKYVLIDSKNGTEISELYRKIVPLYHSNKLLVWKDSAWGMINTEGQIELNAVYQRINSDFYSRNEPFLALLKDNKYAIYNFETHTYLSDFIFEEVYYLGILLGVKQNNKYGACDSNGLLIIPIEYDELKRDLSDISNNILKIKGVKEGKTVIFNEMGKCIENCE